MDTSQLMFRDGLMKGERILVTGGGTGLGKEMAEGFLKLGAEVHICGRRGGVCEETAKELMEKHGGKVVPHACDIRVAEAITDMNDEIWSKHGPLTGLVNNAAGNFISRTEDLSIRGFDAISNIVFRGTFYMTQDIGKRWIKGGKASPSSGAAMACVSMPSRPAPSPPKACRNAFHRMPKAPSAWIAAHPTRWAALARCTNWSTWPCC